MAKTALSMSANDVRDRERLIIEMIRAGKPRQEIADDLGYADDSAITKAFERITRRITAQGLDEVRSQEVDRIDALMQTLWPKARKGDDKAIASVIRLMDRRARYLGLDFQDGIAERQIALAESQAGLLVTIIQAVLGDLNLSEEQQALVGPVTRKHLEAIDTIAS